MFAPAPRQRPHDRIVAIHRATAELLLRPIRGRGGFQTVLRRIQEGVEFGAPEFTPVPTGLAGGDVFYGDTVSLEVTDFQTLLQWNGARYGRLSGGFQQCVSALLADVFLNELAYPEPRRGQLGLPFDAAVVAPRRSLRLVRGGKG